MVLNKNHAGQAESGASKETQGNKSSRRLSIAPMLDWTDRHYRYFARQITRETWFYTEMVTTGALIHGDVERHLRFDEAEHPLALQLGGSDPAELAHCARLARSWGYDEVNLNVGCPSERVQKGAFGACLMAEPDLVADCIKAMRDAADIDVTVKHRIGIDQVEDYGYVADFVDRLARAGCHTFIVHARNAILKGLSPKDNREKLDIAEVIRIFDLKNVNRKNAAFDLDKCTWLSGEYLREMDGETFQQRAREAFGRAGIELAAFSPEYVHAAIETCRGKVKIFSELPVYAGFYFKSDVQYDPEAAAKQFTAENRPRVEAVRAAFAGLEPFDAAGIETALKGTAAALGVKVGVLVHPTRLALTGAPSGPSLYHLIEVLGKKTVLGRIDLALTRIP